MALKCSINDKFDENRILESRTTKLLRFNCWNSITLLRLHNLLFTITHSNVQYIYYRAIFTYSANRPFYPFSFI